ncbi:5-methyltetrahydropteroyltriglutamate--homocysteine S-methyltransferase [Holzapfeliella sp. He02]|uniref:5-methyltetrahydropteroyltriglutamate--homocysteine S-methyltransferase n=1 Tax=Holzapfeliella saturejae TaxID=3082953 RepID=A0ABU8SFU2_9LACO
MPKINGTLSHYDTVGSFLRPESLKIAREEFNQNKITQADLTQIENEEIKKLVQKQKEVGLKIVTDGELRRSYWHLDTFWGFDGISHTKQEHGYLFHGVETRNDSAQVSGKIKFNPNHPDLLAFKYLQSLVEHDDELVARQSIPAPAQLYAELVRGPENIEAIGRFYSSEDQLIEDVAQAYHDLIIALYNEGCRHVKLDDCTWGMIADKSFWKTISKDYQDIDRLKALYLSFNNRALADLPEDLAVTTHVCRGNYASKWAASGGYETVADTLFAKENVSAFYLEFDDDRSGDFEPLQQVTPGKEVVLGLITSKNPELESKEVIKARIKEASQYVPLEKLSLSTQCGFASTEEGNHLTEEQQWDKIKLVIEIANEVFAVDKVK